MDKPNIKKLYDRIIQQENPREFTAAFLAFASSVKPQETSTEKTA